MFRYFRYYRIPLVLWLCAYSACACAITEEQLRFRVAETTQTFRDLSAVGTVTYKNKEALAKIEPNYAQMYEFKTATVYLKMPDKIRIDGKLGMVKFEYIINGGLKIVRSPTVRINKKQDYSRDPAKLQSALDLGLVTPTMWTNRKVEVLSDPEAETAGEIKIKLSWPKGNMTYLAWLDANNLYLKRFEKRDDAGSLQVRIVYSNHQKVRDVVWMPLKVEIFASDGEKAGVSEFSQIKVNAGLADSLFQ